MSTDRLSPHAGEWLKGTGAEADIVISTRIRLARNLATYPFVGRATPRQRAELARLLHKGAMESNVAPGLFYIELADIGDIDRGLLVERHLISREHAEAEGPRGVAVGEGEVVSIMTNEEDHLRMQAIFSGLELQKTWYNISQVDDRLGEAFSYAFSPRYGYLTACPTNVGTGMRVSVMLHLPGLVATRHLDRVFNAVSRIDLVVRGLYGEGTQAFGNFYQISNQKTLGKSEQEIIESLAGVIPEVISYERRVRQALLKESRTELEDQVWRAYSILRAARTISSEETMHLLSQLRLGVDLGLIPDVSVHTINQHFMLTQPCHVQKTAGRVLAPEERNVVRADFLRKHLGEDGKAAPEC